MSDIFLPDIGEDLYDEHQAGPPILPLQKISLYIESMIGKIHCENCMISWYPCMISYLYKYFWISISWILTLWNRSVLTPNGKVPNLNWWWRKRLLLLASTWLLKSFQVSRWIVAVTKPRPVLIALRWLISKLIIPPFGFFDWSNIALWQSFNGRCNICISLRIFNFASHFIRVQMFQIDL